MRKLDLKSNMTKRVALSGILLAFALILSVVENMLPPILPALPYAKIGLTNIVLLSCFMVVGVREGYVVLVLKCVLAAVFAGNMSMLLWSLPGALVAYTAMVLLYKTNIFSIVGLSMAGGMLHNLAQILIATIVVNMSVFAYLPYMLLAGGIAGFVTGIICHLLLSVVKNNIKFADRANENTTVIEASLVSSKDISYDAYNGDELNNIEVVNISDNASIAEDESAAEDTSSIDGASGVKDTISSDDV